MRVHLEFVQKVVEVLMLHLGRVPVPSNTWRSHFFVGLTGVIFDSNRVSRVSGGRTIV